MNLPKLMTPEEVGAYLQVSEDTLARWRASGEGPAAVRIGQRIAYTENAVAAYITAQETGSKAATPAAIAAAMQTSRAGVREALTERRESMQALDRQQTSEDPYAVTVGNVGGSAPGIEQFVFQNGKWVPGSALSQPVVQPNPVAPIIQGR